MGEPTWMYRRGADGGTEARVFDADAIPDGWVESPARLGPVSATLDLTALTRKQLYTYARTTFGVDLHMRQGRAGLLGQVRALIEASGTGGTGDDRI